MNGKRKILLLMISVSILIFSTCSGKKVEIVIMKESASSTGNEKATVNIDEESKPLIRIGPTDTVKIMVRQDGAPGMYLG
ncbi:hypothetical protein, partial [Oceanispirochaeta sp.]|uniref:hypothetical protein n=1 Tax=Oceanispirochaeta sp. TaxID=2035350 RepID=UPI00260ADB94